MTPITPDDVTALRRGLREAEALCGHMRGLVQGCLALLEHGPSTGVEGGLQGPVSREGWIATHRGGRPSPFDVDEELRSFVEARLGRMTFAEIAAEVAASFPEGRRTSVSALSRYWRRTRGIGTTKPRRQT